MENKDTKIDVLEIMKGIKENAKIARMKADSDFLKSLDIKNLKGVPGEIFSDNQNDFSLISKLKLKKVQKKGVFGKIINFGLRKFYFALRFLLDSVFTTQEKFNEKVSRFMDKRSKELNFDYLKFEEKFRGEKSAILEKQKKYLRFFENRKKVLDIAFGRGEFLNFLKNEGIGAIGVDNYSPFVLDAKKIGLDVCESDALSFVQNFEGVFDGAFCAQFAEHIESAYLFSLIQSVYEKLENNSFFVMETINPKSLSVFSNSVYMDPTHFRPIHPETLKFLFENAGFRDVSFIFSGEFSDKEKLEKVSEENEKDRVYNRNIAKLNELLFAPQDYAVVGKK